jgi:hypothetical protein
MMGLLQDLKSVLALVGLFSLIFIIVSLLDFIPSESLPEQIQQVVLWTRDNGLELLLILCLPVVCYTVLKLALWFRKRENRSLGGLPI